MKKAKELSNKEAMILFVNEVKSIVDKVKKKKIPESNKIDEFAFSILLLIDGKGEIDFPAWILAPLQSEEDRKFFKEKGKDYFPDNESSDIKCNIAGYLHELYINKLK